MGNTNLARISAKSKIPSCSCRKCAHTRRRGRLRVGVRLWRLWHAHVPADRVADPLEPGHGLQPRVARLLARPPGQAGPRRQRRARCPLQRNNQQVNYTSPYQKVVRVLFADARAAQSFVSKHASSHIGQSSEADIGHLADSIKRHRLY